MASPKMDIIQWATIILVSLASFNWFTVEIFGIDLLVQMFGFNMMLVTTIKSIVGILGLFSLIWALRGVYKQYL